MAEEQSPEPLLPALRLVDPVLEQLRMMLTANMEAWDAASSDLETQLSYHIDQYRDRSRKLRQQQLDILVDAYSRPSAQQVLGSREEYMIPPTDQSIFVCRDKIISYRPKAKASSEAKDDSTFDGQLSMPVESSQPENQHPQNESDRVVSEQETLSPPTYSGNQEVGNRPLRCTKTYSKRRNRALHNNLQPTPSSTSIPANPALVSITSTDSIPTIRGYEVSPLTEAHWSIDLKLTKSIPIKKDKVRKQNLWVFPYEIDHQLALFVLRCPENCGSSTFSRHPLKQTRAVKHFKRCQVNFKDEQDMVKRYAQQVVKDRPKRPVTLRWAIWHNNTLFAEREKHLRITSLE
ncbi:hypothetical protein EsH8_VIII_000265 [Colletotrichum jinshuiense]